MNANIVAGKIYLIEGAWYGRVRLWNSTKEDDLRETARKNREAVIAKIKLLGVSDDDIKHL